MVSADLSLTVPVADDTVQKVLTMRTTVARTN